MLPCHRAREPLVLHENVVGCGQQQLDRDFGYLYVVVREVFEPTTLGPPSNRKRQLCLLVLRSMLQDFQAEKIIKRMTFCHRDMKRPQAEAAKKDYLLTGHGKSHFSKQLKQRIRGKHHSSDKLRHMQMMNQVMYKHMLEDQLEKLQV